MEKLEVVIASGNEHKVKEYRDILEPLGIKVSSLKDENIVLDVEENGKDFAENSMIKARAVKRVTNKSVLADDSGLCINALDGFPGIYSARFMEGHPYEEKHFAILEMLKDKEDKSAYFICAMSIIIDGEEYKLQGRVDGEIVSPKSKGNVFWYDPIFLPSGGELTFGEMDEEKKNKISHRGRASAELINFFSKL